MVLQSAFALRVLAIAVIGAGLASVAAAPLAAITLTNRDDTERAIRIIETGKSREMMVAPGATIEKVCERGCLIRIDGDPTRDFVLEGIERVSIEEGLLYYDGKVVKRPTP